MVDYEQVIPYGQVATITATFADSDTGVLTNPSLVTLEAEWVNSYGQYTVSSFTWSGVDTENIERVSTGVFKGIFSIVDDVEQFSLKLYGSGAITGASPVVYFRVVP